MAQATGGLPDFLSAEWFPTVMGLVAIPLLIVPLDVLAHWVRLPASARLLASGTYDGILSADPQRFFPSCQQCRARLRQQAAEGFSISLKR